MFHVISLGTVVICEFLLSCWGVEKWRIDQQKKKPTVNDTNANRIVLKLSFIMIGKFSSVA